MVVLKQHLSIYVNKVLHFVTLTLSQNYGFKKDDTTVA